MSQFYCAGCFLNTLEKLELKKDLSFFYTLITVMQKAARL